MHESIMMSNKQIIELVAIALLALVGYKFISSGIQVNKEKAVLQEKFNLEQKAKEPLKLCLNGISSTSITNPEFDNIMSNPVAMQYGIALEAKRRCFSKTNEQEKARCTLDYIFSPEINDEEKQSRFHVMMENITAQLALEERAKDECYRINK